MSYPLCGHRKPDGLPCGSPALRNQRLCYYHHRDLQYLLKFARDRRRAEVCDWQLPALDSIADVQAARKRIWYELLAGRLDHQRAGVMLYTLQEVSTFLRSGGEE